MKNFIKKVATGPKGNEDLSFEESQMAMEYLLSKNISDVEKASFLVGWRLKPETIEEYRGALSVILNKTKKQPIANSFELGFPFDGKNDSPYLFPITAKILNRVGIKLVVTGDDLIPAKDGVTTKMLHLELQKKGIQQYYNYFDRSEYLSEYSSLTEVRNLIGLRTALNTLEKISLVGESQFGATGVFHKPYVEKYAAIFEDKLSRFLLVAGNEGAPEVAKKSKFWIVSNSQREEFFVDPNEFGIDPIHRDGGYSINDHLALAEDPPENIWNMSCLNAALYLFVIKPESSLGENFHLLKGLCK